MKLRSAKPLILGSMTVVLLLASGCHSAYIEATVHNGTGGPVTLLEVDYPSASFGTEALPNGGSFHYRFKILGSGATKVSWTDATRKEHTVPGPSLQEGEEGHLSVTLTPANATWDTQLNAKH